MTSQSGHAGGNPSQAQTTIEKHPSHKKPHAAARHHPPKHWIVVTDAKTAHIYRKTPKGIERIPDTNQCCSQPFPENSHTEDNFLRSLAAWLNAAEREKAFDYLVLIGPPEKLDTVYQHLKENVHNRICSALRREIAEVTENEIEDHLAEIVWL